MPPFAGIHGQFADVETICCGLAPLAQFSRLAAAAGRMSITVFDKNLWVPFLISQRKLFHVKSVDSARASLRILPCTDKDIRFSKQMIMKLFGQLIMILSLSQETGIFPDSQNFLG